MAPEDLPQLTKTAKKSDNVRDAIPVSHLAAMTVVLAFLATAIPLLAGGAQAASYVRRRGRVDAAKSKDQR